MKKMRIGAVVLWVAMSAAGCGKEQAKIVMPENPRPLPDSQKRLSMEGERAAVEIGNLQSE